MILKPTVSQLLDLLNKPALLKWSNKIWLEWIKLEDYQKKSKSDWISLHKQIENYIKNEIPFENAEHQNNFDILFKDLSILTVEENIETDYFIWRLDIRIDWREKYICDFKSSDRIYFENKLQLTAYKMAKPDYKTAVIEIPSFKFKPIELDYEKYSKILINLSEIWKLKKELEIW